MAIDTTGQNLIDGVKRYVPEMQSAANDATIIAFINHERRFLLGKKQVQSQEVHLSFVTQNLVADEPLYPLADDFIKLKKVMRKNADGNWRLCERVDREQFRIWEHDSKIFSDDAFFYALRGEHLDLRGIPTTNITTGLRVDYWYLPDEWVAGDTIPQVWELFRELLEVGAALRTGIKREDDRRELERHYDVRLLPHFLSNFGQRAAEPMVMRDHRALWRPSPGAGRFGRIR